MIDVAALIALNMPFCVFFYSKFDVFSCHNLLFVWGKSFGRCSKHVERFMSFLVGFDCCFHLWSYPFNLHSLCKHGTIEFQKKIQGCGTPQEFLSQLPNPPKKKRKNKRRAVTLTCCRLVVSFPSGYHGLHSLCIEFYAGKSGQTCNHDRYTGLVGGVRWCPIPSSTRALWCNTF